MKQLLVLMLTLATTASTVAASPVTVGEDGDAYRLCNGIVSAKIDKRSGGLASLRYHDIEILDPTRSHPQGYWSHSAASDRITQTITIDPKSNGGERGEVSIKGISHGRRMGYGPGGSVIADIEIRYCLSRDLSGIYTCCIFDHQADYPATSVGEARFCSKLNDSVFDWMTVDANRNLKMPTAYDWNHGTVMNMKEARLLSTGILQGHVEHKYDYSANQFDVRAWGWCSTGEEVGVWFINPTIEYLSGGPTKMELSAHRDATFNPDDKTAPAPPCLLNYWRGSHYGGSSCVVSEGERWTKVIGPFLIYCNAGPTPQAMWNDALTRSDAEAAQWPYEWVDEIDYPHKNQRASVSGSLALNDPQSSAPRPEHLLVGLTAPDYTVPAFRGGTRQIDWQLDAKHYQFWARGDADGQFTISNIRPGTYTLHAIADNVLGEFAKTDVIVTGGQKLDLGRLEWKPVRHGRQLWEIGVPDRTAGEFLHGGHPWQWGLYNRYPKDFPDDVRFVIGKSDFHKDWNIMQVPRAHGEDDTGRGRGDATAWTISFLLAQPPPPQRKATLRLAFAAWETRSLAVAINDTHVDTLAGLLNNGAIHRDCDRGYWQARDVVFDASLLKVGDNTIKLTIPAGPVTAGVEYDYLRLELDDRPDRGE